MGKLEGKVAVIHGWIERHGAGESPSGSLKKAPMVSHHGPEAGGARRGRQADGRNVTGVRGNAANLDDLDRLFDTVKREKGRIDVLYASAGNGRSRPTGRDYRAAFRCDLRLNTRGTLFTVQRALPLFNDGGSIFMTGSVASVKGFPGYGVYSASKRRCAHSHALGSTN